MRVEAILFANRATVDNWLLAIEGGGWEYTEYSFLPSTVVGCVAGVLALDEGEHGELSEVILDVFDDSGQVEGSRASTIAIGTRPKTVEGVPYRSPFAMPFMTVVRGPTVMKARLTTAGHELALITCEIRSSTPDVLPDQFS
jgi:hypothetical protein